MPSFQLSFSEGLEDFLNQIHLSSIIIFCLFFYFFFLQNDLMVNVAEGLVEVYHLILCLDTLCCKVFLFLPKEGWPYTSRISSSS